MEKVSRNDLIDILQNEFGQSWNVLKNKTTKELQEELDKMVQEQLKDGQGDF